MLVVLTDLLEVLHTSDITKLAIKFKEVKILFSSLTTKHTREEDYWCLQNMIFPQMLYTCNVVFKLGAAFPARKLDMNNVCFVFLF